MALAALLLAAFAVPCARAVEHVTLANGFEIDCVRREAHGDKVRLYLAPTANGEENYMDVAASAVLRVETLPDPMPLAKAVEPAALKPAAPNLQPTRDELAEMLAHAGAAHNVDADLLASVMKAESGGQVRAVSRTGARGLMQLMPGTAATLGVRDAFIPTQNIEGGTRYLDQLLTRYHDNIALALAAYNAGPGAVDKYHGIPPYRETVNYVARVIREFNRRKTALMAVSTRKGSR
jgi:soluble lytic murein transglycosylase-like protein